MTKSGASPSPCGTPLLESLLALPDPPPAYLIILNPCLVPTEHAVAAIVGELILTSLSIRVFPSTSIS